MKITARLKRPLPLYVVKFRSGYVTGSHTVSTGKGAQGYALAWRSRARAQREANRWGKHWGMRVVKVVARRPK